MKRPARKLMLLLAAVVAVGIVVFRGPMQRAAMRWRVLQTEAPAYAAMMEMVEQDRRPAVRLRQLWETQKIPHRSFVLDELRRKDANPSLQLADVRDIVLAAAHGGDVDAQQAALMVLQMHDDPAAEQLALAMLHDIDPELRQVALRSLADDESLRLAPVFLAMRKDPDRITRQYALGALSRLTEEDISGPIDRKADDAPIFDRWQNWYDARADQVSDPATLSPADAWWTQPTGISTDFTLPDVAGKPFHFDDVRGKVIVLNFWATWCAPCVAEIPTLQALAHARPNDVVVIGVCVDATPEDKMHPDEVLETYDEAVKRIRAFVAERKIDYPILIDRAGGVTNAYGGSGLPTNVIIDPTGQIRRRFIGERSLEVLEAMVDQARSAPQTLQTARAR